MPSTKQPTFDSLLTDQFRSQIKQYEGGEFNKDENGNYKVYINPATKSLTVGHGHIVCDDDNLSEGDLISKETADKLFESDLIAAATACKDNFSSKWDLIPFDKKQVLIGLYFQLGSKIVNSFMKLIYAINTQDWLEAAKQMRDTTWFKDFCTLKGEFAVDGAKHLVDVMEYEGDISELNDENLNNETPIGGILLSMKQSNMNRFYGLNIDAVTQQVNFIGKQITMEQTDDNTDEKLEETDNNNNTNDLKSSLSTWYHFYTFLLLFYEKGMQEQISFSLDIDGKVEQKIQDRQQEPHRLKKVYYPESHLRWSRAGEVMFKADWFIKTLLYNLDPKITDLIENYQSFVDLSFKYEAQNDAAKNADDDNGDKEDKASAQNEEWHRLWIVIDSIDESADTETSTSPSLWIEDIKFKIKIKRMNVTDDGDLKDTENDDDESPILQDFINNVNENMEAIQNNSPLLKNLSNVYRALLFAKFIYENNVPIDISMLKKISLKQKMELKSNNINFTLPAYKQSYQRTEENKRRGTITTRDMYFEGGIDLDLNRDKLKLQKDKNSIQQTLEKMKQILLHKHEKIILGDDSKYYKQLTKENDTNEIILGNNNSNNITTAAMATLRGFVVESLPTQLFFQMKKGLEKMVGIDTNNNKNNNKNGDFVLLDTDSEKLNKFTCAYNGCGKNLFWQKRKMYDGKIYCAEHYDKERYAKCNRCGEIMDGEKDSWLTVDNDYRTDDDGGKGDDLNFHEKCFTCKECNKPLKNSTFEFEKSTQSVFCSVECLRRSHGDTEKDRYVECYKCKENIDKWNTNEPITGIRDNKYIFHTKCFNCWQCGKELDSFYEFEKNNNKDKDKDKDINKGDVDNDEKSDQINEESSDIKDKTDRKDIELFCSLECKYESDGKDQEKRYIKCYLCNKSIDQWTSDEELITVNTKNAGEIIFHADCFQCFECKKPLNAYYEFINDGKKMDTEKKSVLLCSVECKHRYDGETEEDRYFECPKCKNNIDLWINENKLTTIHGGKTIFHADCFSCFKCNKPLDSFFECYTEEDFNPSSLYLFCSTDCQPQKMFIKQKE